MQFSARKGIKFKVENINEFKQSDKEAITISLKVFDVEKNKSGTIKYSHPEIAAALIGYCMYLKIPLPRPGKKSILSIDQGLMLNIKIQ